MPLPSDRIYSIARAHLDAVVAYYAGVAASLPERQYVSDGNAVAWDCEQLVVYVERTYQGYSDAETGQAIDQLEVRSAALWLEVVRCSPAVDGNDIPTAVEIETNAQLVLADAVMLAAAVRAAYKAGDLGDCHGLTIGEWQALGPAGGYVGGRQGVRHQLTAV